MRTYCPKCDRARRTGHRRKRVKGQLCWIIYCAVCGAEISIETDNGEKFKVDS